MTDLTSVSLLHQLRDSADVDAWSRFDAEYRGFVFRFLNSRKVDRHVAEDICQNVMKQVCEVMTSGGFEHNGHTGAFRNWLRKVVASQLAVYRRKTRKNDVPLPAGLEEELGRDDSRLVHLWNHEHNRAVLFAVLELLQGHTPDDSLAIFRRMFIDGATAEHVAEEFGRTKNAVVVVKCKVLKKARELVGNLTE